MTGNETMKQQWEFSIIVKHIPSKQSFFFTKEQPICDSAFVEAGQILPSGFFPINRKINGDDDKKLEDVNRNVCAKSGMPEAHQA